ncbi:hypothetical protein KFK09_016047 [Dendrobium nobile]|uniref:Reverse transcriptase domain-containing protein n=1 Tax=Dendrobium nobile TaxID=94219 RepID=A0A8T3B6E4_DENNO|nr:hypothetical protein KFK09_016047 [Dendrobium nobile]
MEASLLSSGFPQLSSGGAVCSTPRNWSKVLAFENTTPKALNFSHFPDEPEIISFTGEKLHHGGDDWKLCLVGYSIGRRPYYEALLGAIKKTWSLKGSVQLLSLSEGFFLLRFSCSDDFEMVWSRGVWFLLGKPFVLQKWHPKFKPKKEDFKTVPIWVKIHDLPLACWNSEGISRIASKIGVPIAADNLTELKTRLTFARICVLVDCHATYPEEIKVSLDGDVCLKVQYEWRPFPCAHCKSLMHISSSCPSKPDVAGVDNGADNVLVNGQKRGRSFSRKPTSHNKSSTHHLDSNPAAHSDIPNSSNVVTSDPKPGLGVSNVIEKSLHYQPHSLPPFKATSLPNVHLQVQDDTVSQAAGGVLVSGIPNLNSPNEAASSSTNIIRSKSPPAKKYIISPNKFDALTIEDESLSHMNDLVGSEGFSSAGLADGDGENIQKEDGKSKAPQSNTVSKKSAKGKQIKKPQKQSKIHVHSLSDQFFESSHSLFPNEASCHNFDLFLSGRIWIKWNPIKVNFTPYVTTSQLISGIVSRVSFTSFQLTAVYASNSNIDRKALREDLNSVAPVDTIPWAIIGDFNCCRYAYEKLGGTPINQAALLDFNNMIFNNCLFDLHSIGCKYSWFNQRQDNPIHIKLDRALVNDAWVKAFPDSYCSFQSPSCSDHSPILIHLRTLFQAKHRFLFKNFWTKLDKFWFLLVEALLIPSTGYPLSHLCNTLRNFKNIIKSQHWASSSCVSRHIDSLHKKQKDLLVSLHSDPTNTLLNQDYKVNNVNLANFSSMQASWIIQRAKVNWLRHGEDDLKFLYAKIRTRMGSKKSVLNLLACNSQSSREDVISTIINYFQELYNPTPPSNMALDSFPIGNVLNDDFASSIISVVTDEEIKTAVFTGSSTSAPGPDGFNFHFFKTAWHILGPTVCRAIKSFFSKGFLPKGVKSTSLAIIPKHNNAASISEYRPIALCNVMYKIISKVMAARLKPFMSWIVKDTQDGFVKSRVSTDNILLASDILFMLDRGFKGISLGNFSLTHLLYADDVLIFGEATIGNCQILDSTLKEFANSSSLFVNHDKSSIMFPKHLKNHQEICQVLNIHNIATKITYLGIPLSFYGLKIADFLSLTNSLNKKLNDWKANLLSFAGRLQYLKFTIQNTIAYWIRSSIIPKSVHKSFKRISSRFLFFGDVNKARKLHMVAWDKITMPKIKGGLGIHSLNALQFAYNCSIIIRMYNSPSPLAMWLLEKYSSPWKPPHFSDSKLWKSICKTAMHCKSLFQFKIFHNSPISFKWDHWCFNSTIENYTGLDVNFASPEIKLSELISGGRWELPRVIPPSFHQVFERVNINDGNGHCLLWNSSNCFRFKHYILEFYSDIPDCNWFHLIWHKKHILKHSVYAWLALMGGLKTADALRFRHIFIPSICSLCNMHEESVTHLYFECSFTFNILKSIIPGLGIFLLRPSIMQTLDWINGEFSGQTEILNFYNLAVCCIIYYTWKEKNCRRFGGYGCFGAELFWVISGDLILLGWHVLLQLMLILLWILPHICFLY